MSEAKIVGIVEAEEIDRLLALRREGELTPAQLQRLDLLLEQRGQAIERHLELLNFYNTRAA